jgi:hypothetical protein
MRSIEARGVGLGSLLVQRVGFARSPGPVSARVVDAAAAAADGAVQLVGVCGGGGSWEPVGVSVCAGRERLRELGGVVADSYLGALERGDFLELGWALDRLLDRIEQLAVAVGRAGPADGRWSAAAGVLRDLARELAAALRLLDGPPGARDSHLQRLRAVHDEGRRLLREARRAVLSGPAAPALAIRHLGVLDAFERALSAARAAGDTTGRIVAKHA